MPRDVIILSLGAGVQSSALALMASSGKFGKLPDAAVFADTQWEPRKVYLWLTKLEQVLKFPVIHTTRGSLRDAVFKNNNATGKRFASIPWFILNSDGTKGMSRRQCTSEYKISPIRKVVREMMGYAPRQRVKTRADVWIGISADEALRAKPSRDKWQINRWPLLEIGYTRADCLNWIKREYPTIGLPPKSACIGCPFHSDSHWVEMRKYDQESWNEAVAADREIRNQPKMRGQQFMHRSLVPLDQVVFKLRDPTNNFNNECEGLCGV